MNSISDSELKVLIKNNYLKFLKRIASDEEIEYHFNQIKNKTISLDELDSIFQNSQEYKDLVMHNNKIQNISKDFEEIILNIKNFHNNPLPSSDEGPIGQKPVNMASSFVVIAAVWKVGFSPIVASLIS